MTGRLPSMYFRFCWFLAAPLLIMVRNKWIKRSILINKNFRVVLKLGTWIKRNDWKLLTESSEVWLNTELRLEARNYSRDCFRRNTLCFFEHNNDADCQFLLSVPHLHSIQCSRWSSG
jgi:hypothetical protein